MIVVENTIVVVQNTMLYDSVVLSYSRDSTWLNSSDSKITVKAIAFGRDLIELQEQMRSWD